MVGCISYRRRLPQRFLNGKIRRIFERQVTTPTSSEPQNAVHMLEGKLIAPVIPAGTEGRALRCDACESINVPFRRSFKKRSVTLVQRSQKLAAKICLRISKMWRKLSADRQQDSAVPMTPALDVAVFLVWVDRGQLPRPPWGRYA